MTEHRVEDCACFREALDRLRRLEEPAAVCLCGSGGRPCECAWCTAIRDRRHVREALADLVRRKVQR